MTGVNVDPALPRLYSSGSTLRILIDRSVILRSSVARRQTKKNPTKSLEQLRGETLTELRSIIRLRTEVRAPVQLFAQVNGRPPDSPQYYVCFDQSPPCAVTGLRIGALTLRLPDGAIEDKFYECAKAIWHLKDRLHQWGKATNHSVGIEEWVAKSTPLLICADLANLKKHGRHEQRSGMQPKLRPEITFDTSRNGVIEFFYDGAMKRKVLYVSNPIPIPFAAEVTREDDEGQVIGDAATILDAGF